MMKYYYAIDVGGTSTKGGIVDVNNNLLYRESIKTIIDNKNNSLAGCILALIDKLEKISNLPIKKAKGLGIGIPGEIDAKNGIVCVSNNLGLHNYKIVGELKKHLDLPIKIANDANLATLGEFKLGAARNYKNFVMLTLGTGIGGELFIEGKPYSSISPFSGEFGHIKIFDGQHKKCACGEYDCYELYGSTRALSHQVKSAMLKNKNSKMWQTYNQYNVNGKTVFEYLNKDKTADEVFAKYIEYLGTGIVSIVNLLMPEAIIIGGSISNEKEILTKPLEDYVNSHIYAKNISNCKIKIIPAQLGADAGIYGAKNLFD